MLITLTNNNIILKKITLTLPGPKSESEWDNSYIKTMLEKYILDIEIIF